MKQIASSPLLSSIIDLIDDLIFYKDKHFKDINDNFGHDIGDTVLQNFGALLENNIRETDHLFRIGREEFVILSESKTKVDAIKLAEKLRLIVASTPLLSQINVTISLGICEVTKGDSPNSIAKRVDNLLYEAKTHGKNKVTYHSIA